MADYYVKLPPSGGSGGVTSLNSETGAINIVAGTGITVTPAGQNITIAATGGTGTVTSVSVVTANGLAGTVATATTTPAITLSTTITGILQGNGTAISAATTGNLTDAGTDGITVTGGTGAVLGTGTSLSQHVADTTHNGYLSSTDWNTFNGKQGAGNYITALTGDGTATGPGSVAFTLATVNGNVGSFGSSSAVPSFTVNAKGLITAASSQQLSLTTGVSGVLPIANGGTNNSSAYTNGSIIFSNGTSLTQDNANFFWNDTNQSIGIGTNTPSSAAFIDAVSSTGATKRVMLTGYGASSFVGFRGRFARGTSGSPAAAQNGDILGFLNAQGYGASQFSAVATGGITITAGETFTNTSNLTYVVINSTATGSVTPVENFRVASTGVTIGPQSSSTAIHQINGGVAGTVRSVSANVTLDTTTTDYIVFADTSGGVFTITLPTPAAGRMFFIKDSTGSFNTNNLTLAPHSSEKIEGLASSKLLTTAWGSWTLATNGTDWFFV